MTIIDMHTKLQSQLTQLNSGSSSHVRLSAIVSRLSELTVSHGSEMVSDEIEKLVKRFSPNASNESLNQLEEYLNNVDRATKGGISGASKGCTDTNDIGKDSTNTKGENGSRSTKSTDAPTGRDFNRKLSIFVGFGVSIILAVIAVVLGTCVPELSKEQNTVYFIAGSIIAVIGMGASSGIATKRFNSELRDESESCLQVNRHIIRAVWIIPIISAVFVVPIIVIPLITHDFYIQSAWGIIWIISIVLSGLLSIAEFVLVGRGLGGLINTYSVLAFMGWFIELLIVFFASQIGGLISNKMFFLYNLISVPFFVLPFGTTILIKKKSRVTLKRRLPHLLSMFIFMFVFLMPFYVWSQQDYLQAYFNEASIGDGFYYEWIYTINDNNTLTVHLCFDGKDIVVPRTINGRSVTTIGETIGADIDGSDARTVRKISISDTVTSIESGAFSCCGNLTYIFIPSSVTEIGHNAFIGCNSLIIYCEATSKPNGWDLNWNYNWGNSSIPVVWGASRED